jgi:hypothetical protein
MMTFEQFMSAMLKPTYVWRMASGVVHPWHREDDDERPLVKSGRTRMANAQRRIDDLVLERAAVIADERRCAAVHEVYLSESRQPEHVRCEYQRGHEPIHGRGATSTGQMTMHAEIYDHGAPSAKVWWNE